MAWDRRSGSSPAPPGRSRSWLRGGGLAVESTPPTTEPTPSPSPRSEPAQKRSTSSSRSSWSRAPWVGWGLSLWSGLRGGLPLLLALLTLASAPGCCSEPLTPTPVLAPAQLLPPGRPENRSPLIQAALDRATLEGTTWAIPSEDLELILADRAEWQAWAAALEAAGRWR